MEKSCVWMMPVGHSSTICYVAAEIRSPMSSIYSGSMEWICDGGH